MKLPVFLALDFSWIISGTFNYESSFDSDVYDQVYISDHQEPLAAIEGPLPEELWVQAIDKFAGWSFPCTNPYVHEAGCGLE